MPTGQPLSCGCCQGPMSNQLQLCSKHPTTCSAGSTSPAPTLRAGHQASTARQHLQLLQPSSSGASVQVLHSRCCGGCPSRYWASHGCQLALAMHPECLLEHILWDASAWAGWAHRQVDA